MKKICFLCLLTCFSFLLIAQPNFQRTFGGIGSVLNGKLISTNDGGFIVTGTTSPDTIAQKIWVCKMNFEGTIQWSKFYNPPNLFYTTDIKQDLNGDYIILGGYCNCGTVVYKIDSTGNLIWSKSFLCGEGNSICIKNDGSYLIAGTNDHASILNIDTSGNIIKYVGWEIPNATLSFNGSTPTDDNGVVVYGRYLPSAGGLADRSCIAKYDSLNNKVWNYILENGRNSLGFDVQKTSDGGYVACGFNYDLDSNVYYMNLVRFNGNGSIRWSKDFLSDSLIKIFKIIIDRNGNFVAGGIKVNDYTTGMEPANFLLIKTDSLGNLIWANCYANFKQSYFESVQESIYGGYYFSGTAYDFTRPLPIQGEQFIMHVDENGNSGCDQRPCIIYERFSSANLISTGTADSGCTASNFPLTLDTAMFIEHLICSTIGIDETAFPDIKVYPVPAQNSLNIDLKDADFSKFHYSIVDLSGRNIKSGTQKISTSQFEIDISDIVSGIYFISLFNENKTYTVRFIKTH